MMESLAIRKALQWSPNDNLLYVADTGNNKVQVFRINTENTEISEEEDNNILTKNSSEIESLKDKKLDNINEGGCLIATAAYGTELAPQVQHLREIRDNTVLTTASGSAFMTGFNTIYYSFAPTVADMERENPMFQDAVRVFITPMISSLSIMSLAEGGSESEVLGLGISVILLNLGMYIAAPALIGIKIHNYFKPRELG